MFAWRLALRWFLALAALGGLADCMPAPATGPPARSPNAQAASEILPADLDVMLWLDIARLRGLWSVKPNVQLATILAEYGLFDATGDSSGETTSDAAFWLRLITESDKIWIACRPTAAGCTDPVVFARGRFERPDPLVLIPDLKRPLDLGAGWLRFDRSISTTRQRSARIYLAPPDRIVVVSLAELDAVERSLEQRAGDTSLRVEERGLFSMVLRGASVSRALAERAPAAARFLREAKSLRLWIDSNAESLGLTVVIEFADPQRAERAKLAFQLIANRLDWFAANQASDAFRAEVVGNDLTLRLRLNPPNRSEGEGRGGLEPAKQ